jgi:hypothetical protein
MYAYFKCAHFTYVCKYVSHGGAPNPSGGAVWRGWIYIIFSIFDFMSRAAAPSKYFYN